jgi:hypothetical protein
MFHRILLSPAHLLTQTLLSHFLLLLDVFGCFVVVAAAVGVTNFRGGFRPAIVPAGYVGVAFWGGVFVALSGSKLGATIASSVFMFALLVCLRYSPNALLVGLCIGFIVVTLAVVLIEWLVFEGILEYITLFYGTFIGYVAVLVLRSHCFFKVRPVGNRIWTSGSDFSITHVLDAFATFVRPFSHSVLSPHLLIFPLT